ncbi:MAG: hypothetical protein AAFV53_05010 [Myxococcota bacterium]
MGGVRLRIRGVREDDAAWSQETRERVLAEPEIAALRQRLNTGRDSSIDVEAWGRIYTQYYSLHPPSDSWESGEYVWFYPMSGTRMTLRVAAAPLRKALCVLLNGKATSEDGS